MSRRKKIVLGISAILCISVVVIGYAIIYNTKHIDNNATIVGEGTLGIYEDSVCSIELTSIEWGEFNNTVGIHEKTKTIYLKNLGTSKIYVRYYSLDFDGWDDKVGTRGYYDYCISSPSEYAWLLMLFRASDDSRIASMNSTTPTVIELGYNEKIELYFTLVAMEYALPEDTQSFITYFRASDS